MFGFNPFDMIYDEPSYYSARPAYAYVQHPYQRYAPSALQSTAPVYVEDAEDELAEYVERVRAAEEARAQAQRELLYHQQQLAQARKLAYQRAVERERKQREAQQAAYMQALQAERARRAKLAEQQMMLREQELQRERELEQRRQQQLQQRQSQQSSEDQMKREFLTQLLGEMFGPQIQRQLEHQSANKQSNKPASIKSSSKQQSAEQSKQQQPAAAKQSVERQSIKQPISQSDFFIPVRVINSSEQSNKHADKPSSAGSRVNVPLTVNTAPSSPVMIEDEPITPEQWNLDASDVFKADRVLTPSPSEPASPKQSASDL